MATLGSEKTPVWTGCGIALVGRPEFSSHIFFTQTVQNCSLGEQLSLGKTDQFFEGCDGCLTVRKMSFCIPAAEERIDFRCLHIPCLPLLLRQQTSYKERSISTHLVPNRAFQPLVTLLTCYSRCVSLSWVLWLIPLTSAHEKLR